MREGFTVEEVSMCLEGLLQEMGHEVEVTINKSRFFTKLKGKMYTNPFSNFSIKMKRDLNSNLHRSWLLTLNVEIDLEVQVEAFLTDNIKEMLS